jgi:nicotinate dehydrogenase subunit A
MALRQESGLAITVNGRPHDVRATPDTPLYYVLRNELRLNAAKFGCGLSRCGACTVLVDGRPERSCVYPVRDAVGKQVTTLEGLGTADNLHPLQQAFLDEQALQCGYCVPGMIMTAAALLNRNEQPDEAAVREALADNLCRCGAHVRIIRAVLRAAGTEASGVRR